MTKEEDLIALYNGCESYFSSKVDIFCNNAGINHIPGWKKCMEIDIVCILDLKGKPLFGQKRWKFFIFLPETS